MLKQSINPQFQAWKSSGVLPQICALCQLRMAITVVSIYMSTYWFEWLLKNELKQRIIVNARIYCDVLYKANYTVHFILLERLVYFLMSWAHNYISQSQNTACRRTLYSSMVLGLMTQDPDYHFLVLTA